MFEEKYHSNYKDNFYYLEKDALSFIKKIEEDYSDNKLDVYFLYNRNHEFGEWLKEKYKYLAEQNKKDS